MSQEQPVNALPLLSAFPVFEQRQLSDRVADLLSLRLYHRVSKQLRPHEVEQLDSLLEEGSSAHLSDFLDDRLPKHEVIVNEESKKFVAV